MRYTLLSIIIIFILVLISIIYFNKKELFFQPNTATWKRDTGINGTQYLIDLTDSTPNRNLVLKKNLFVNYDPSDIEKITN